MRESPAPAESSSHAIAAPLHADEYSARTVSIVLPIVSNVTDCIRGSTTKYTWSGVGGLESHGRSKSSDRPVVSPITDAVVSVKIGSSSLPQPSTGCEADEQSMSCG